MHGPFVCAACTLRRQIRHQRWRPATPHVRSPPLPAPPHTQQASLKYELPSCPGTLVDLRTDSDVANMWEELDEFTAVRRLGAAVRAVEVGFGQSGVVRLVVGVVGGGRGAGQGGGAVREGIVL